VPLVLVDNMSVRTQNRIAPSVIIVAAMLILSSSATEESYGQKRTKSTARVGAVASRPSIWHDPGAVEKLDFANGPGGFANAPKPPFTFLEEDTGGTNPKIKVKDKAGQTWGVKWGEEVHSEAFASRLAWAAGYWVEPTYFVSSGRIDGVKGLGRAKKHVASDGSFSNARFELKEKGIKKQTGEESWRWDRNPFVGTREENGLKILIMLTSNWDPKDQRDDSSNTAIYTVKKTGEIRYVFSDWGATMGKWGGYFKREKWDCAGYTTQTAKFVTGVENGMVRFGYDGKRASEIRSGIRTSHVAWLLRYIGRITDAQIGAGLRASGATAQEVGCFTTAFRDRINQLRRVAEGEPK
jgi:hypothetical protein